MIKRTEMPAFHMAARAIKTRENSEGEIIGGA